MPQPRPGTDKYINKFKTKTKNWIPCTKPSGSSGMGHQPLLTQHLEQKRHGFWAAQSQICTALSGIPGLTWTWTLSPTFPSTSIMDALSQGALVTKLWNTEQPEGFNDILKAPGGWAQGCGSIAAASAHRMKFCHVGQEILCLKWRNSRVAWQMAWTAGWVKNWGLDEINLWHTQFLCGHQTLRSCVFSCSLSIWSDPDPKYI